MDLNKRSLFFAAFFVLFGFFSASFVAGVAMNVSGPVFIPPNGTMNFSANVFNNSNLTGGYNGSNITVYIDGSLSNYSTSESSGNASVPVNAPVSYGSHNVTIITDQGISKQFSFYVSNVTQGNATFVGAKKPPFSVNDTFTVQVVALNSTGSAVNNTQLEAKVFEDMGKEVSNWTVTNLSATTDAGGVMQFNITIPSTASSGQYAFIVERGAVVLIFNILSGYVLAVNTQASTGEVAADFYPGQVVSVVGKVRSTGGDPQTGANLTAYVTQPNGSIVSIALSEYNSTNFPGVYNNSFSLTSTSGSYGVRVDANVSGSTIEAYSSFNIKSIKARLKEQEDFVFDPFKDKKAFSPGGTVRLNLLVYNLTDGSLLTGAVTGAASSQVNCTATQIYDVYYPSNGSSVTIASNNTNVTGNQFSTTVCGINFTAPTASGFYGVRVNVTLGNNSANTTAEGFFAVQTYLVKANPVNEMGGGFHFITIFSPGDNATFQVKAFNLSSGAAVAAASIGIVNVSKLVPLDFGSGVTAVNNPAFWADNSSNTVKITIPNGTVGAYTAEIVALIGGEEVRGSAFFMTKYVEGFLFAGGAGGGPGGPPPGGGPGPAEGGGGSQCNGATTFNGFVFDVKTNQNAQGVQFNTIQEARNEMTGKDVTGCLSLSAGSTDQNGQASISINITNNATCSWSGFYFMLINVSYKGNTDLIPSGFVCRNLEFFPMITTVGSTGGVDAWRVSPNSAIQVNVTTASYINGTALPTGGIMTFPQVFNFNPSTGGRALQNNTPISASLGVNGTGGVTVYPQNFSIGGVNLTKWPNGFMDIQPRVCIGSVCDTSFGGFEVVAFDAWTECTGPNCWGAQYAPGENVSTTVRAKTNVSTIGNFTVKIGRPWEGNLVTVPVNETYPVQLEDNWNSTNDTGTEQWNVTYTVPSGVLKGGNDVLITVNSSAGDTAEVHQWMSITKFSVAVPAEEGVGPIQFAQFNGSNANNTQGWNFSYVNASLGIVSKSGVVGIKNGTSSTSFGTFGAAANNYNDSAGNSLLIMIIDPVISGVYDTVLVTNGTCLAASCSTASKTLKIVNTSSASNRIMWYDGTAGTVYFRDAPDCCYLRLANASSSGGGGFSWAGVFQADTKFYVPYIVTKGSAAQSNVTVGVQGVIKQDLKAGGSGGFGFQNNLDSSAFSVENSTSDANGMAFIALTVSDSGAFSIFWNMTASNGDTDAATFETGTQAEIKRYATFGGKANYTKLGLFNMTRKTSPFTDAGFWRSSGSNASYPYYEANVTEATDGDLLSDGAAKSYYFYYGDNSNNSPTYLQLGIDDDNDLSTDAGPGDAFSFTNAFVNGTLRPNTGGGNAELKVVSEIDYDASTKQILLFNKPNFDFANINGSNTGNWTAYVCAETFDRPEPFGVANATVQLFTRQFSFSGETLYYMDLKDPVTGLSSSSVQTGPSGCAIFNFTKPSNLSWQCWGNLEGTLTKNLSDSITFTRLIDQNMSVNSTAYVVSNFTDLTSNREVFRFGSTRVKAVRIAIANSSTGAGGESTTIGKVYYRNPVTNYFVAASGNASYFPASSAKAVGGFEGAGGQTNLFVQDNSTYYLTLSFLGGIFNGTGYGEGVVAPTADDLASDSGQNNNLTIDASRLNATLVYQRGQFTENVYVGNVENQTACGGGFGGAFYGP